MKIPALLSVCLVSLAFCQPANAQGRLPRGALLARPLIGSHHSGSKFTKGHSILQKPASTQKQFKLPMGHVAQKGYFTQKSHVAARQYVAQKGHVSSKGCGECCSNGCGGSLYLPGLSCAFERIDAMLNRVLVCHKFGMTKCDSPCGSKYQSRGCGCSVKSSCGCSVQKTPAATSTPYYAPPLLPDEQVNPFEDDDVRAPLPPPLLDHSVQTKTTTRDEPSVAAIRKNSEELSVSATSTEDATSSELRFKEVKLINHEAPIR